MKKYFEIEEIIQNDEIDGDADIPQPQKICIEIKDNLEAPGLIDKFEPLFSGRHYRIQIHNHYHSDENQPCEVIVIKEV